MPTPLIAIVRTPLDLDALVEAVALAQGLRDEGCGAVASFAGLVRRQNAGRQVRHLEYEAFDALAMNVFRQIAEEAAAEWPAAILGLHHRTGRVEIGEASVIIAAGTAHRADAFSVCRYGIERVKQIAPVWKREYFDGGDVWIEGAIANPQDSAAREAARACASR